VALPVLKDQTHYSSYLVECGICQPFVPLQGLQPLLDFERLKTEGCPFAPPVDAAVLEYAFVPCNRGKLLNSSRDNSS